MFGPSLILQWRSLIFSCMLLKDSLAAPCTICTNGESITKPNRVLNISGVAPITIDTCSTLDQIVGFVQSDSEDCQAIQQNVAFLCGCPIPEGACRLCPVLNSTLRDPDFVLPDNPDNVFDHGLVPDGFVFTCEALQAVATSHSNDSEFCSIWSGGCQCMVEAAVSNETKAPQHEAPDNDTATAKCTLCPFGEPSPFPAKEVLQDDTYGAVTCGILEFSAGGFDAESTDCTGLRRLAKMCGCRIPQGKCSLCPDGSVPEPMKKYQFLASAGKNDHTNSGEETEFFSEVSCELLDSALSILSTTEVNPCFATQMRGGVCGCPNPKMTALIWTMRGSAMLSLIGSWSIILNILLSDKRKTLWFNIYHQLMLAISVFDTISSIGYLCSALVVPEAYGYPGARGSSQTCLIQGFLIQLGMGSIFYNLVLSIHFTLSAFRTLRNQGGIRLSPLWVHPPLVLVAVALAFGALPFYHVGLYYCYMVPPPQAESYVPLIMFFIAPTSFCILGATCATLLLWWRVRSITSRGDRYTNDQHTATNALTSRVFWTSFWYLVGFWATFPVIFVTYFVDFTPSTYWLFVLASVLTPLQGFWNAIVFFMRKRNSCKAFGAACACFTFLHVNASRYLTPRRMQSSVSGQVQSPVSGQALQTTSVTGSQTDINHGGETTLESISEKCDGVECKVENGEPFA